MDSDTIEAYIDALAAPLGGVRQPVNPQKLRWLYAQQDFKGIITTVRASMGLEKINLRVGIVNAGGDDNAPAWINHRLETHVPFYQSSATLYVRRHFIEERKFETVVACLAHEFSHLILDGIHHRLKDHEEAVDLTAMLLGYREFYRLGCHYTEDRPASQKQLGFKGLGARLFGQPTPTGHCVEYSLGYLAKHDINYAIHVMHHLPQAQ